jgi:hypothetical protein
VIKTTTSSIKFLDSGVIINRLKTRSAFKQVYILESNSAIKHVVGEVKHPLIVDLTKIGKTSFDEINQVLQKDTLNLCSSMALVINSSWQRMILNLWYQFNAPGFPIQFFASTDEAKVWIDINLSISSEQKISA